MKKTGYELRTLSLGAENIGIGYTLLSAFGMLTFSIIKKEKEKLFMLKTVERELRV